MNAKSSLLFVWLPVYKAQAKTRSGHKILLHAMSGKYTHRLEGSQLLYIVYQLTDSYVMRTLVLCSLIEKLIYRSMYEETHTVKVFHECLKNLHDHLFFNFQRWIYDPKRRLISEAYNLEKQNYLDRLIYMSCKN